MKEIKNLANIGTGDILGNAVSAGFWFYLAILISPEIYGELHYFISIVGIAISFVLSTIIQATYFYITSKKWDRGNNIEKSI